MEVRNANREFNTFSSPVRPIAWGLRPRTSTPEIGRTGRLQTLTNPSAKPIAGTALNAWHMEHAYRDRATKRYPIWRFRRVWVFANVRCKIGYARRRIVLFETPLFCKAFWPHARRAGRAARGPEL